MPSITVVVVDDHPIFRQGVINSISFDEDIRVVGQAKDGPSALQVIRDLQPDVAIVDINLPGMNGQQVVRVLVNEKIPTKTMLLTAYDDLEQKLHAIQSGAVAYCSKDVSPEFLIQAIKSLMQGKFVIDQQIKDYAQIQQWVIEKTTGSVHAYSNPGQPYHPLSKREMEVLTHIISGKSNKEIATLLGISHQTVKNHVTAILRKLDVEDRTQAAVFALQRGWVRVAKYQTQKSGEE